MAYLFNQSYNKEFKSNVSSLYLEIWQKLRIFGLKLLFDLFIMANKYDFELEFKVRDYECDLQGVVNNSVYQNYLEHTRHEFLLSIGLNFAELFQRGIIVLVARVNLAYKNSLRSGERFVSRLRVERQGVKYLFYQDIYRLPDEKLCLKGVITSTSIVNGRLAVSDEIQCAFAKVVERRD